MDSFAVGNPGPSTASGEDCGEKRESVSSKPETSMAADLPPASSSSSDKQLDEAETDTAVPISQLFEDCKAAHSFADIEVSKMHLYWYEFQSVVRKDMFQYHNRFKRFRIFSECNGIETSWKSKTDQSQKHYKAEEEEVRKHLEALKRDLNKVFTCLKSLRWKVMDSDSKLETSSKKVINLNDEAEASLDSLLVALDRINGTLKALKDLLQ